MYLTERLWLTLLLACLLPASLEAQAYVSYRSGPDTDTLTTPQGGVCLMGGSREDDEAMKWFLRRANGGDVLVLRASGSDGYNDYFFSELGIPVHSVETIRFDRASASAVDYIHRRIQEAEAIWFAGGDQWNYVNFWRNTPIDSLVNRAVQERNIVIGGTSAGMAILGEYYFSAQNGTVSTAEAIANPYRPEVQIDTSCFLRVPFMEMVITDTHYSERDREGRHAVFLARVLEDYGIPARGIACDERTAVCIDPAGRAYVYGRGDTAGDQAFFIQSNCNLSDPVPEQCLPSQPLVWRRDKTALKVYRILGTPEGNRYFDLNDWQSGQGGNWQHWYVEDRQAFLISGSPILCTAVTLTEKTPAASLRIYPNPASATVNLAFAHFPEGKYNLELWSATGKSVYQKAGIPATDTEIDVRALPRGLYYLQVTKDGQRLIYQPLILSK
ncbi:MAG TPA: T9SS type A sorting domain-containing protein [Saprospiraceae bacterium]|nr:T9SS type A sorting domain-containing protein [Saprospiraceae bacterium]